MAETEVKVTQVRENLWLAPGRLEAGLAFDRRGCPACPTSHTAQSSVLLPPGVCLTLRGVAPQAGNLATGGAKPEPLYFGFHKGQRPLPPCLRRYGWWSVMSKALSGHHSGLNATKFSPGEGGICQALSPLAGTVACV